MKESPSQMTMSNFLTTTAGNEMTESSEFTTQLQYQKDITDHEAMHSDTTDTRLTGSSEMTSSIGTTEPTTTPFTLQTLLTNQQSTEKSTYTLGTDKTMKATTSQNGEMINTTVSIALNNSSALYTATMKTDTYISSTDPLQTNGHSTAVTEKANMTEGMSTKHDKNVSTASPTSTQSSPLVSTITSKELSTMSPAGTTETFSTHQDKMTSVINTGTEYMSTSSSQAISGAMLGSETDSSLTVTSTESFHPGTTSLESKEDTSPQSSVHPHLTSPGSENSTQASTDGEAGTVSVDDNVSGSGMSTLYTMTPDTVQSTMSLTELSTNEVVTDVPDN